METQVEVVKPRRQQVQAYKPPQTPEAIIENATQAANVLKNVIEKQCLYNIIQGKKHVRVDAWVALGKLMGVSPKEVSVKELPDGSFEAYVEIVRDADGHVIGGASSLCGMDETRWRKAEKYARRSMSVTRATGKAFRLAFSWVMVMAGYEATPAEEMPHEEKQGYPAQGSNPFLDRAEVAIENELYNKAPYSGTVQQKRALAKICREHGVTEREDMALIGELCQGIIMENLEAAVIEWKGDRNVTK